MQASIQTSMHQRPRSAFEAFWIAVLLVCTPAWANAVPPESDKPEIAEEITVIGSQSAARELGGSGHRLENLYQQAITDIHQALRQVPGVYVRDEEGYGLRPNIGIRGSGSERSARVTLMEDGILIAPAPYAAPAAYYFPTAGRLSSVEVVKGPSAVRNGPQTVGGVVNMLSTPYGSGGRVALEAGNEAHQRLHAHYSGAGDRLDWLVETHQWDAGGFRNVDFSSADTGLDKQDYLAKGRWHSRLNARLAQSLDIRISRASENSNQSYLGLTEVDYRGDPLRRYAISQRDNFDAEHSSLAARYIVESDNSRFTLTYYDNEFERNWFKLDGVDADGSTGVGAANYSKTSLSSVINALNAPEPDLASDATANALWNTYQGILTGEDTASGALIMKDNAREYQSGGWDAQWRYQPEGQPQHQLYLGLRMHEDEEDRLQRYSTWRLQDGNMLLDDWGVWGDGGNRLSEAEALSIYAQYQWRSEQWLIVPGVRYENVEQRRQDWQAGVPRSSDSQTRNRRNTFSTWLPGVSLTRFINDRYRFLAGIHKGSVPAGNSSDQAPEENRNYEAGFRYEAGGLSMEAIAFFNDYQNLLGTCTASTGSDCEVGEQFSGRGVTTLGLEYQIQGSIAPSVTYKIDYSWIRAEFESSFASRFFGDVTKGDPLPYIPEHQLNIQMGYEGASNYRAYADFTYADETCSNASCGEYDTTQAYWSLNLRGDYRVNERFHLYTRIDNLFDNSKIVSRSPYGAFSQRPRKWILGLRWELP